jgi:hypothetical protein
MSAPKTFFNEWILSKIVAHLSQREGCNVIKVGFTSEGAESVIEDAFGYQYEVTVRTMGRVQTDSSELEVRYGKEK